MTIAINPHTVAASIAALVMPNGVTIKGLDTIPDAGHLIIPVVFPRPNEFITSVEPETMSFGSMGTQAQNFTYTLNYVFLFTEIGSGINAFAPYEDMITKLVDILNVILNNDAVTGLVDMQLEGITGIGSIDDPAGNQFWGAFFSLRCLEYSG